MTDIWREKMIGSISITKPCRPVLLVTFDYKFSDKLKNVKRNSKIQRILSRNFH